MKDDSNTNTNTGANTDANGTLKSALKKSSKSKAPAKVQPPTPSPEFEKPEHKHKGVIVELCVDFKKPIFEQFNSDRSKAFSYAMQELHRNMTIGDNTVWICHESNPDVGIGRGGVNVPTNMMQMCNYTLGLSPKIFQTKGTSNANDSTDNLDSIGGPSGSKGGKKRNTTVAYFQMRISCNKDPLMLVSQVSFEWGKFGFYIRLKELQALDTQSQYCFYFLFSQVSKSILSEEIKDVLQRAQKMMWDDESVYDVPYEYGTMDIPIFNLRMNVPKLPGANTHKHKVPTRYEGTKRHFQMEVCFEDLAFFKAIIDYAKSKRLFKDTMGPHVHVTECITYESSPGDLKRSEKFYIKSMNYNASLTASDVDKDSWI